MEYYLTSMAGLLIALCAICAADKDEAGRRRINALENENKRLRRALEDFKK